MNSTLRILAAIGSVTIGALATVALLAVADGGSAIDAPTVIFVFFSAVLSFGIFAGAILTTQPRSVGITSGFIASYATIFVLGFALDLLFGGGESVMWLPFVIIFGTLYLFPLIFMSCLGGIIATDDIRENRNKAATDQLNEGRNIDNRK